MPKYIIDAIIFAFLVLFIDFQIGYVANGLKNGFDLKSVWEGVGALSGAGFMAMIRYIVDSFRNSKDGQMPYDKEEGRD